MRMAAIATPISRAPLSAASAAFAGVVPSKKGGDTGGGGGGKGGGGKSGGGKGGGGKGAGLVAPSQLSGGGDVLPDAGPPDAGLPALLLHAAVSLVSCCAPLLICALPSPPRGSLTHSAVDRRAAGGAAREGGHG